MGATKKPEPIVVNAKSVWEEVESFKKVGKVTICYFALFNPEMEGEWLFKIMKIDNRMSEKDAYKLCKEDGFMPAEPEHMMAQVFSFYKKLCEKKHSVNWDLVSLGSEIGEKTLMLSSRKDVMPKLFVMGTAPWDWNGYFSPGAYLLMVKRKNS